MAQNATTLNDRVKQLSYITGNGDYIELADGAANGFSTFRRHYSHDDIVFYAITDGTECKVGSGLFKDKDHSSVDTFVVTLYSEALQVVILIMVELILEQEQKKFTTHPATHAVIMGSGLRF